MGGPAPPGEGNLTSPERCSRSVAISARKSAISSERRRFPSSARISWNPACPSDRDSTNARHDRDRFEVLNACHHHGTKTPRKDEKNLILQEETAVTEKAEAFLCYHCNNSFSAFPWCLGAFVVKKPHSSEINYVRRANRRFAHRCERRSVRAVDGPFCSWPSHCLRNVRYC